MIQEQQRMDTLTNNLANSDTVGFKKEGLTSQSFDSVFVDKIKDGSEAYHYGRRIGTANPGVKIGESYVDWSEGAFEVTDNEVDFAIGGKGFFSIEFTNKAGETRTMYTRDGNFQVTTDGYLVTTDGDYVLGKGANGQGERIKLDPTQNKPIVVDMTKDFVVDQEGYIIQDGKNVAKLQVTDFADYNYLEHYGENYYYPIDGAELQDATGAKIFQGYLESSNVGIVSEMVEMISVSRQYEANQKIIQTYDRSLEVAVTQLGRLS